MPTRSTIRYAAKQAYQLLLMTGKRDCRCAGLQCFIITNKDDELEVMVYESDVFVDSVIPAKCWREL